MLVNSSAPTRSVRSVYEIGRDALPQPTRVRSTRLVHVDRLTVRRRRIEQRRDPHGDADTTMTCRIGRNKGIAVDRIGTGEVHRVVKGPEGDYGRSPDMSTRSGLLPLAPPPPALVMTQLQSSRASSTSLTGNGGLRPPSRSAMRCTSETSRGCPSRERRASRFPLE